jgi:alkanesulfonate monooxygenase SsuD/methylene tetrahydromethanopterin reductase-like flavin-dependent oxidoreductase (luciferase family)
VVGGSGDAALQRVARYADGWHAIHSDVEKIRAARAQLEDLSQGRAIEIQLRLSANVSGSPRIEGPGIEGDPDAVRAAVDAYRLAGVDLLIVDFHEHMLEDFIGQLKTFAEYVGVGDAR